ncbi:MAG: HEPN domain-containing protein [Clostridiaceae bacterium]|jgi:HEPN domain-containing protein|nr:HEPN domain-containing protein [Clostridiaceae bacterium]
MIKTHDLDALHEKLPGKEKAIFESLDLTWLTEWSVESRYPGDWPEALVEDAKKAVKIATEVLDTCSSIFENDEA